MNLISGDTAPDLYTEAWWIMRIGSVEEPSRNGSVMTLQEPTRLRLADPTKRVIFDPERDCNPFFHVMETVWMFAGESKVDWLEQFNKGYRKYAEDNGEVWGAYGARWRAHYNSYSGDNPNDQISSVIRVLRKDPFDRRAVIGMWDPSCDLDAPCRDVPCNTHIYFRVVNGALNMTVCNRSNDMIWGALGANIVHMTYLHELIARGAGIPIGEYVVLSNNMHVYKDREDVKRLWDTSVPVDPYLLGLKTYPLLQGEETVDQLLRDCEKLVSVNYTPPTDYFDAETLWMRRVAHPMFRAYLEKTRRQEWIDRIAADDWRVACQEWADRRELAASSNPSPTASQDS
jgi:hypothetical protein